MKVITYPADEGGCGRYRITWPTKALADQGADVRAVRPGEPGQLEAAFVDDPAPHMVDVIAPDADVVVLQRPLQRHLADVVPLLQAKGVAVVVEIDDDFSAIHPRNASFETCHPGHSPDRNWQHLARACREADLVTVSTDALATVYGGHGRVAVIPNCVPAGYLDVTKDPHDGVIVGWSGSIQTHPDDLEVTRGGVARALTATGAHFAVVGTGVGVQSRLDLDQPPTASGWVEIEDYPHAMAQLDIGIVPLADNRFNRGKSWLKGLEWAALGVPFIASPVAEYRRLIAAGAGRSAERPRRWYAETRALVEHEALRDTIAGRGREVAARWTIEGNTYRWWDAWGQALLNHRHRTRSAA